MLKFKAYFHDESVCIDSCSYKSNETLTACLGFPAEELSDCLVQLWKLVPRAQLYGGSSEQLRAFLDCMQQAQKLFLRLGALASQLPPFSHGVLSRILFEPRLSYTLDGLCSAGGMSQVQIDDSAHFTVIYFPRISSTLTQLSAKEAMEKLERLNSEVAALFEEYIFLADDILQAQKAYSVLLEKYIHTKRAFLGGTELADCFAHYIADVMQTDIREKLPLSCCVPSSYSLYKDHDGIERLCLVCDFERLRDFLYIDFFRGLERSFLPRRCDNCGQYFLLTGGKYSSYCERPLPDDPEKTCRSVGAKKRYGSKCKNDPVWLAYNRAYKTHYARYMKGKMTAPEFECWSRYAVSLREQASDGTLGTEQYERMIKE